VLRPKHIVQFQKISIHTPWEVIGDSKGGEDLKSQIFRGKYKAKLIFPKGWEWDTPPLPLGRGGRGREEVWIFSI